MLGTKCYVICVAQEMGVVIIWATLYQGYEVYI